MSEHVLITGADGYVGRLLARRYLEQTDARLSLLVRARDAASQARKVASLSGFLGADIHGRVHYVFGDLTVPGWQNQVERSSLTTIVHSAAVTRLNVDLSLARASNVEATEQVLTFAEQCPVLQQFGLVSTVYASGLREGHLSEEPFDGRQTFANHYEWSKWHAERAVLQRCGVRTKIARVATVIADDPSGTVTQYNAFHNTLRLCYHGLLPVLPGDAATPIFVVTGDFVATALFSVMRPEAADGVYHLCHSVAQNPTLAVLFDRAFDAFERDAEFRSRGISRPTFVSEREFRAHVRDTAWRASLVNTLALNSMTPFAPQLYIAKQLDNSRLAAVCPNDAPLPPGVLVGHVAHELAATHWGRRPRSTSASPVSA